MKQKGRHGIGQMKVLGMSSAQGRVGDEREKREASEKNKGQGGDKMGH